ncbi:type II toxin-antitoxin system VapC family toxin [Candidatus Shapirobacteria bacterium]|nr:type II toxin-antitoxin system VapC family toxin [Candidatus Shapirobacteria bacterium]
MKILLDSSVLIEVMRRRIGLDSEKEYFINPIVYGEIAYGLENMGKDLEEFDYFLESKNIYVVDINTITSKFYAKLKVNLKNNPIADNDLLIACSALENKMILWTLNKKHFGRVKGLELK